MRHYAYSMQKDFGRRRPAARFFLPVLAIVLSQGCAEKQLRVRPWQTAMAVRPNIPVPAPGYKPESPESSAPDLIWQIPSPPSALNIDRQPIRPHVPVVQPAEPAEVHKPAAPSLEPQLSSQEIAAAQQEMNESAAAAQKNLGAAKGHRLNPTQTDLVSKVTSFLEESKQAVQEGDWNRAKNLAKKARVLSEELAASL